MVSFTSIPAFGFETATCNATGFLQEMQKKDVPKVRDLQKEVLSQHMSNMQAIPGLENMPDLADEAMAGVEEFNQELGNSTAKSAWKTHNIVKALGYIPLLGTLIGLGRISRSAKATQEELPNKFNHIVRGCIELCSLGFLLLIPDLILTSYRTCHAGNTNSSVKE
jgi:hypothetical protein